MTATTVFHAAAVEALQIPLAELSADGTILAVNSAWNEALEDQRAPSTVARVGEHYPTRLRQASDEAGVHGEALAAGIQVLLSGTLTQFTREFPVRSSQGESWLLLHASPLPSHIGGAVVTLTDVTTVKRQALRDPLTDLPNRALFLDRLELALAGAGRRDDLIAVLYLDLDDFKVINDSFGYAAGDELLVAVSRRLVYALGPDDTVARLSGDEFGILLRDLGSGRDAQRLAERVLSVLRRPFMAAGRAVTISASIGGAVSGTTSQVAQTAELLNAAEQALCEAKRAGKEQVRLVTPALTPAEPVDA